MKEHLDKVKFAASRSLTRNVVAALNESRLQIEAQAARFAGAKLPPIAEEAPGIAQRFSDNLWGYFDSLTTLQDATTEIEPDDYDSLSLVDHDYLEAMIAMEGMVKQMRDKEFKGAKSFVTRLEAMFPNVKITETNNPLDPEQIGDCFNEAIRPLGLKAHYLLTIYREFNKQVFGKYEDTLNEANEVLVELGVLPNLDITAEERERRKAKRLEARAQLEEELKRKQEAEEAKQAARGSEAKPAAAAEAPSGSREAEMFTMMQTLIKSLADKQDGAAGNLVSSAADAATAADQDELRQQQTKLMGMLTEIQSKLLSGGETPARASDIGQSINQNLHEQQAKGDIGAIDHGSADVINLVTMLYEAIWKDRALPVVMKELIGRTQIAIMKVALRDNEFFQNDKHPGRTLINEMAQAGIAWTETDALDTDPVYSQMKALVDKLLGAAEVDTALLQQLVNELRACMSQQTGLDANLEQRVKESENVASNMEDIHNYVTQKINERVLKGYLDPAIRKLLDTHIHNFLVKLILKEGPEGKSWKPVMSTIDVMLWTVQVDKQPGDRERFNRINPRLLDNLEKALQIGGASKTKITKSMRHIKQIQEYTFHRAETEGKVGEAGAMTARKEPPPLSRDDPYLSRVDKLPIGTWFEFKDADDKPIRCSLAAKIDSIDKLFFANRDGKKVAEMTRLRLASELKAGSARVISTGTLVNRAMRTMISDLKETAQQQGSGGQDRDVATA